MSAAIQSFYAWTTAKKKVLILGEMKELGDARLKEHQKIIDLINGYHWHTICLVGPSFKEIGEVNGQLYFNDVEELKTWYEIQEFTDTAFLIKASRGMTLEKMIKSIKPYSAH